MSADEEKTLYRELRFILKHGAASLQDALLDIVNQLYRTVRQAKAYRD